MKKIGLLLITLMCFFMVATPVIAEDAVSTDNIVIVHDGQEITVPIDEDYTIDEILALFADTKFMILDYKELISESKEGFTFNLAVTWVVTLLISLVILGGIILLVCWVIKWFTPKEIDEKIEKFEVVVRKIMIGPLMTILNMLRIAVKGK